jgi:hypothetical protein
MLEETQEVSEENLRGEHVVLSERNSKYFIPQ